MKNSPILSVHLGDLLKKRWIDHCRQQSVKPSTALRQVVIHLLNRNNLQSNHAIEVVDQPDKTRTRIEIKLTDSELLKIESIAKELGYSRNMWVAHLVRSYLTKANQFGMRELEILSESNSQLLRVGRNLNQLTRQINTSLAEADRLKVSEIEQLSNDISAHVRSVSTVIQANIERWKLK
jgi:hypothetical protein